MHSLLLLAAWKFYAQPIPIRELIKPELTTYTKFRSATNRYSQELMLIPTDFGFKRLDYLTPLRQ